MDVIKKAIVDWLREILIGGITSNLSGMFDSVNEKVGEAIVEVGKSPSAWNSSIFNMVQNLSETVMIPIAGVILAFVMTLELIQLVTDRNNLHDIDTWMFFKWSFKTAAAVLIVTNTWNIVMGIFDAAQSVVNSAGGVIVSDASIDISSVVTDLETRLAEMELGPLFGLWFQSLFVGITMWALTICIFIIVYGRMIEIYLVTSIAPIPTRFTEFLPSVRLKKMIFRCKNRFAVTSQKSKAGWLSRSFRKKAFPATRYPPKTATPFRKFSMMLRLANSIFCLCSCLTGSDDGMMKHHSL